MAEKKRSTDHTPAQPPTPPRDDMLELVCLELGKQNELLAQMLARMPRCDEQGNVFIRPDDMLELVCLELGKQNELLAQMLARMPRCDEQGNVFIRPATMPHVLPVPEMPPIPPSVVPSEDGPAEPAGQAATTDGEGS